MGRKARRGRGSFCLLRRLISAPAVAGCLALTSVAQLGPCAAAGSPVWAIHGPSNTLYLAGSVHLLKADDASLPAAFNRAYAGSRGLVMELDLDHVDPLEAAAWMMQHGMLPEGVTLRTRLGDSRYRRVAQTAGRLGVPPELLDRLQPWVVGLQLMEAQYQQLGFESGSGVEQQLERRAQADGKSIQGLETIGDQLGVLGAMSEEDQARFLDMVITGMHDVDGDTRAVITAWRTGNAAQLAALLSNEYESFPALYRTLVSDRNRHWVPQIEKLLREKQDYLVIVGALHLVGDGGLLELLRRDGFRAEQLN